MKQKKPAGKNNKEEQKRIKAEKKAAAAAKKAEASAKKAEKKAAASAKKADVSAEKKAKATEKKATAKPPKDKIKKVRAKKVKAVKASTEKTGAVKSISGRLKRAKAGKPDAQGSSINFFQRMGFKITALVAAAVILASVISMLIVIPSTINVVTQTVKNELRSMVMAYSSQINSRLIDLSGVISFDGYANMLQNLKIEGTESSYAFLVDSFGTVKYHPEDEKVGQKTDNQVIAQIAERVQNGETPDPAVVEYEYNGKTEFAGYQVLSDKSILVVTADKAEILKSVTTMTWLGVIGAIAISVICILIGWFFTRYLVKPIHKLIGVIDETADLDFTDDTKTKAIAKRSDEIGAIGKAVSGMREKLRSMVADIQESSSKIQNDVVRVREVSDKIREECMDNSATTEELAAGMEETSATTGTINGNIDGMKGGAEDILKLSQRGVALSDEITERAVSLKESTNVATKRTTEMYGTIKTQAAKAMEAAESVGRINAMTDSIMQISSQTSLLALNASIEAARAGEAGKGFAVVASEIGKLANETSDSVTNINNIVAEVNASVAEMVRSMEETTKFLESVVLKDYDQFKEVSVQYNNDADVVKTSMKNVEDSVNELNNSIAMIADAINGINSTIDESAVGVTDIAEKTGNVVEETSENAQLVKACVESVEKLNEIARRFKI